LTRMAKNQPGKARSVVVTGASTGIGEACALRLDELAFRVFAGVRREADREALRGKASDRLMPVLMDVTDAASIASALETIGTAVGEEGLAGLVNNAGIAVAGPLEFLPLAELRKQLEVNVIGQIAVMQAFLSLLRRGHGRIVNMGSISGRMATPFLGAYGASKFALEALTDALRVELRPWGISVSIVEPGSIATPIWEKSKAAAAMIEENLPRQVNDRMQKLYGPSIVAMRKAADRIARAAIPADFVAQAVVHALTAKRPKTRYLVGRDARLRAILAKFVPDRVGDTLAVRHLRLPDQRSD